MNNTLVRRIANDLNIKKYNNETDAEYGNRLIYTALAAWARTLVLGESYSDLDNETENVTVDYHNVDRMHVQSRLTQIAYGMLTVVPYCKVWAGNSSIEEQCSDIANEIIESLIFCYELSPLKNVRRLTSSPIRRANFKNNQLLLGGAKWQEPTKMVMVAGLGRWNPRVKKRENYKEIFNLPDCTYDEYYSMLLDSAMWKESDLVRQYKIFRTGTGHFYYNAWGDLDISQLYQGMYLIKNTDVDGGYLLLMRDGNKIYTARLDPWYYNENEIYRIMYVFDKYNGTPAVFRAKMHSDHVLLHCHSRLPNSEMRILLLSSWPKRSYKDVYYRIVPRFIWADVKAVLNNLGVEIKYI